MNMFCIWPFYHYIEQKWFEKNCKPISFFSFENSPDDAVIARRRYISHINKEPIIISTNKLC